MSFLGVKVILFLVIPLIIKEKSNASALRPFHVFITVDVRRLSAGFHPIFSLISQLYINGLDT